MASVSSLSIEEEAQSLFSIEERRALIERIAASEQFRRSTRLRDFLLYVGGQSLKEGCPEIHEQEIGEKVFGRSPSYDRSQDNIVRVNASELRKRIDAYFATEGAHETLLLSIPRGGYRPVFYNRIIENKILSETEAHSLPDSEPDGKRLRLLPHILWTALCLALGIVCLILFEQNRTFRKTLNFWEGQPSVAAFWTGFSPAGRETDIVLPDASVALSEEILGEPIALTDYLDHNYLRQMQDKDISRDRQADLQEIFHHNLVTLGDYHAAQQILALSPMSSSLHLTLSRFYTPDSLKRNNLILIGGQKANPWVRLFADKMNFRLGFNGHIEAFVTNNKPLPGEQAVYKVPRDRNAFTGYSVIAYLPNPSHTRNVIILAGTDSDATGSAAEFLTSEEQLSHLRKLLGFKTFPYFEVLLKNSRLSGASLSAEVLAYRTYSDL